jgi:hypothetical protein
VRVAGWAMTRLGMVAARPSVVAAGRLLRVGGRVAVGLGRVVVQAAGVTHPGGGSWWDVVGGDRANFWVFEREEILHG